MAKWSGQKSLKKWSGEPEQPFSPLNTPTLAAAIFVWVRGDDMTSLGNTAAISSWPNIVPGAAISAFTQAVAGAQPSVRTGLQNSQTAIRFDGTDSLLSNGNIGISGDFTASAFIIAKINSLVTLRPFFHMGATTALNGWGLKIASPASTLSASYDLNTNDYKSDIAIDNTTVALFEIIKSPGAIDTTTTIYKNGVLALDAGGSSANTPNLTNAGMRIGSYISGALQITADIYELLVFNTALSSGDRVLMETYLMTKYGLS